MSAAGATATAGPRAAAVARALVPGPRLRRRLVAVGLLGTLLACAYFFWFRDSALVQVERVTVTGLTSGDSVRIRASLEAEARDMTSLHFDRGTLEQAAEAFSVVRSLEVAPDFPNGLRIHVVEHQPVAVLGLGAKRVPVAADGSVLSGLPVTGPLPRITVAGPLRTARLANGLPMSAVRIAAGLPVALRPRVKEIERDGGKGLVVPLADGPRLIFGTAARARAKWAAAVRVLADRDAAGADYIDVRIPERPVAGGLPVATVAPAPPAGQVASGPEPAVAAASAPAQPEGSGPAPSTSAPSRPAPPPAPLPTGPRSRPQVTAGEGGGAMVNPRP